jgi:hypothetical protein
LGLRHEYFLTRLFCNVLVRPGHTELTRGILLLGYGMGHGPRRTSIVTTRNAVGLLVE